MNRLPPWDQGSSLSDRARGPGEASESVVSGVEFKGIPRNFTVVTSNAFNAVFQKSK